VLHTYGKENFIFNTDSITEVIYQIYLSIIQILDDIFIHIEAQLSWQLCAVKFWLFSTLTLNI